MNKQSTNLFTDQTVQVQAEVTNLKVNQERLKIIYIYS
jgi:hypothetical protein